MPPAFLTVSDSSDERRPSSANGRLESGPATHRTRLQPSKQQPATFLSYTRRASRTTRGGTPSPSSSSSSSLQPRADDDEAPTTTWSQRLLINAQHISPALAQQYALPTASPAYQSTSHHTSSSTHAPALANLAARHLPSSPYLQHHLSILASQLGSDLTAPHLTEREEDDPVRRAVKRAVRHEMRHQTQQRAAEEHKEAADSPPPTYPFTEHATALRQHVLTLSKLQGRFDTLVQSVSRSSSMHSLLASFASSYLTLFSSLLSTLFSLNHHHHFALHHASFTLSAQQAEHAASLSTLQHRLRLQSSATQSSQHLAQIEQQQRQHSAQHVSQLYSILRQQANDVRQQAQQTAEQVDSSTAALGVKRDTMLELSGDTFMHSHQLSLLLNALCYEAEEEAAERAKLDALMDEGRKSAKEMWMNTMAKKREDAAAKLKDKKDREKQTMLAAAAASPTATSPRSGSGGPYTANGFTLLPLLSRFMRGVQTLMSPRRNAASSLDSVNAQLVNILVAVPAGVSVADFPAHLLTVIMTAQANLQAAQRHLRSLFTHCTTNCQQPLPRLVLPLIATHTGKTGQSVFSSGLTPRSGSRAAADDATPPALFPPASFTLHVVAESLRLLQKLIAAGRDKDLSYPVPLLQAQVPALLTAFYVPAADGALQSHLLAYLDAQSLLPAVSLVDFIVQFAASYHGCLADFIRQQLASRAQLEWDELTQVMQAMCSSGKRWETAGKGEVARVYVEWTARRGELAANAGDESDVDEVSVLLDVLSLHRWFMTAA